VNGFEPVPWSDGLPGGGPAERTYEEAVAAWSACWQGADVPRMIANLRDCRILDPTAPQAPLTETRAGVIRQAWICSPWTVFGPYGFSEASKIRAFWPRLSSKGGAVASAAVLGLARPDRCLQVRNFLFSTPIHPIQLNGTELALQMQALAEASGIPVLCRGLAHSWREAEIHDAQARGLIAIPNRVVWLYDAAQAAFLERHNTRMDLALARRTGPLRLCEPAAVEPWVWERLAELYAQLYLQKHNRLNPAYTAAFMKAAALTGLLEFLVFPSPRGQGLEAFVGLFSGAQQSTCPLVGVDIQQQKPAGLYRKCCALCFGLAAARAHRLNFSSGAGQFKRLRGGVPSVEYALLALPQASRLKRKFWATLSQGVERWVVPMLLKEGV